VQLGVECTENVVLVDLGLQLGADPYIGFLAGETVNIHKNSTGADTGGNIHVTVIFVAGFDTFGTQGSCHGGRISHIQTGLAEAAAVHFHQALVAVYGEFAQFAAAADALDFGGIQHGIIQTGIPANKHHGKTGIHHDFGRFRILPDIEFRGRCDIACAKYIFVICKKSRDYMDC